METQVKIYREPENETLILDEDQLREYNELVSELGIAPVEQKMDKCPNVYISLNQAMQKQLKILCPLEEAVESYKRSTIPVEVLRVLKYAKEHKMFDKYYIWSDNQKPDPILIGFNFDSENSREKGYTWNGNRYLLARWGDCALELPELLQLGYDRIKQELLDKANDAMVTLNAILTNTDVYVRKVLAGALSDISIRTNADSI